MLSLVYQAVAKWLLLSMTGQPALPPPAIERLKLMELKTGFCSKKGRLSATQLTPLLADEPPQPEFDAPVVPTMAPSGNIE